MRVLVTGGAGFIGSHLCRSTPRARARGLGPRRSLHRPAREPPHLRAPSRGSASSRATSWTPPLVHGLVAQCDRVFHLAAAVGVKYVLENPLRSLLTNIRGTEVVLEACAAHERQVMVFSSSEVYGKGITVPFAEDDDRVMGPTHKLRWSYACGKAVDECLAQAYYAAAAAAGDDRALLQHLRAAPDRRLRHGDPEHDARARCATSRSWSSATASSRAASRRCSDVVRGVLLLADARERRGRGVQHRHRRGSHGARAGASASGRLCQQRVADRVRALRAGLRQLVRGHAAARAGSGEDPAARRLPPRGPARPAARDARSATPASGWDVPLPVGSPPPERAGPRPSRRPRWA